MKTKILVCYHKKDKLYKNDILVPIHCGRAVAMEESKDGKISQKDYQWLLKNTIGDNTGDNISELNRDINEWSAIYWAWKNYDKLGNPDYIGLMHYRRLFDFSGIIDTTNKKNLLDKLGLKQEGLDNIFQKYDFVYREGFNIQDKTLHTFEVYQKTVNLSESYHPLLYKEYEKFKEEQIFYCNNMFIMKKEDFFNMCEEVFPLMFDIINKPKEEKTTQFREWINKNWSNQRLDKAINKLLVYGYYPRYTSYLMEYISCFYFMYLKDKYKERALSGSIFFAEDTNKKNKRGLLRKIFSVRNEYSHNKKYKVITIAGIKIKIRTDKAKEKALAKAKAKSYDPKLSTKEKKLILEEQFERYVGYKPSIDKPKTFNEKIQWLKLYNEDPLLTKCADKYLVREYVKEKIGEQYLIPLLGVWDKAEDIDFDKLPDKFVLKVNWGSGQNIIVKDKSKLDIQDTVQKLNKWMEPHSNHYFYSFEWCYKDIQPKIIAEEYIQQDNGDLYDYKFFCFNGKAQILEFITDRFTNQANNFFNNNLQKLNIKYDGKNNSDIQPDRNITLKIKELSEKLAINFYHARIDFYAINKKIYFGEITFYSAAGLGKIAPLEWDYKLGDMLTLPERANNGNKNGIKL